MATKDEEKDDELEHEDEESSSDEESSADEGEAEQAESSEDESEEEAADESEDEANESPVVHEKQREEAEAENLADEAKALAAPETATAPTQIGSARYVHAAFFAGGILIAYVSSKILGQAWSSLADWPTATRAVPLLLRFPEDERGTYVMVAGALIGVISVIQTYRNERIRRGADEVALELSKVSWPNRQDVQNSTIVVIVASMIATVYVTLLDRLWSFLTHLVYGA